MVLNNEDQILKSGFTQHLLNARSPSTLAPSSFPDSGHQRLVFLNQCCDQDETQTFSLLPLKEFLETSQAVGQCPAVDRPRSAFARMNWVLGVQLCRQV